MAAGRVVDIVRAPGRIVIDPTQNPQGNTYPFGGTEIGKVNGIVLQALGSVLVVPSEALGEPIDILEPDHSFSVTMFLRGWDDDAIQTLFPGHRSATVTTQHDIMEYPLNEVPGSSALGRAVKVLFVPLDVIHVPCWLVTQGVPYWTEGAQIAWERGSELGMPITFQMTRDSNDIMLRIARKEDMFLS